MMPLQKKIRWGRRIDQFDSRIIIDIVAAQNCCEVMTSGSGSVYLKKVGGLDTSDSRPELILTGVPRVMYFYDYMSENVRYQCVRLVPA